MPLPEPKTPAKAMAGAFRAQTDWQRQEGTKVSETEERHGPARAIIMERYNVAKKIAEAISTFEDATGLTIARVDLAHNWTGKSLVGYARAVESVSVKVEFPEDPDAGGH